MSDENSNPSPSLEGALTQDAVSPKPWRPDAEGPNEVTNALMDLNQYNKIQAEKDRAHLVFQTAQRVLPAIVSSSMLTTALISSMTSGQRVTLGQIVVNEAWDMSEALVAKYEEKLATDANKV